MSVPAAQTTAAVWAAARPYLRARKNDVHVPLSYGFAEALVAHHPEADAEVVLLAVLLHDCGWAAVDQAAIYRDGFGEGMYESDVRIAHEREGVRICREVLGGLGIEERAVEAVAAIIDGHDTRRTARSPEDELMRDADRLWRFTTTGIAVACDWFGLTPADYADHVEAQLAELHSPLSLELARGELARARRELRTGLVG